MKDFSDFVTRALVEYIDRKHPGLIEETAREILLKGSQLGLAAEPPQAKYVITPADIDKAAADALAQPSALERRKGKRNPSAAKKRARV